MKVIVLGAGIIGTSSAWFLHKAGHDVTVIDRQSGAAQETSFANGCQISVSHAEPWANPAAPLKILKWLGKEDAPLLYRPRLDWLQWKWALHFLRECTTSRTDNNIRQIVALCEYSRQTLQAVRAETGITYDHLTRGILHFYTNTREFENSLPAAKLMRELGCPRESIDADAVIGLEPALAHLRHKIVGGDYTASDESGDVHQFTTGLANKAAQGGVQFRYHTTVTRLITEGAGASAKVTGVEIIDDNGVHQVLSADAFVVAMGSFSEQLLTPLGIPLLLYPGKGYSATYQITDSAHAPTVSLTDDEYKIVISRLGNRLRVAGTCELNGYTRDLNPVRCDVITRRTRELFPDACSYTHPQYWTGLRPLTPSNVPYVGKTKFSNLYLNTGHGTLGWTMGCGSGRAIAEIVDGKTPEIDFGFTGLPRKHVTGMPAATGR
jgi:D-amino-acid dehydrogenase